MDRITNINIDGNIVTAIFKSDDVSEVNLLKRAILSEIDTYAIGIVVFHVNNSPRTDEILAARLGQLVIDNTRLVIPETGELKVKMDVTGPKEVTTDDIPGLPFKFKTPITMLRKNERVLCDIIVQQGQGKIHVKWRPIANISFTEAEGGHLIKFKEIGMLTGEEILVRGINKIPAAAARPAQNIFFNKVLPHTPNVL